MIDRRLQTLVKRITQTPDDLDAWVDLARLAFRAGVLPAGLDPFRHTRAAKRAYLAAPREASLAHLVLRFLELVPDSIPDRLPPRFWVENERYENHGGLLTDAESGLPLLVRRRRDGSRMWLIPAGVRRPHNRERFHALARGEPVPIPSIPPFYMDRLPVTVASYERGLEACRVDTPRHFDLQIRHPGRPVVGVSLAEAARYASWVGASLPAESEWQRAAGGGLGIRFPWGDAEPDTTLAAWGSWTRSSQFYEIPSTPRERRAEPRPGPQEVGTHPKGASPYGVEDMAGNVREWCVDLLPLVARGRTRGRRLVRGGSYRCGAAELAIDAQEIRDGKTQYHDVGIRLVIRFTEEPPV